MENDETEPNLSNFQFRQTYDRSRPVGGTILSLIFGI